ncbi:hypothetical protein SDC9_94352 [bioreactor metagenome]|uniref:Uncharacterized protein n=1 Tax=bioreactor metagenome TaxID=1076179 RepID=A0A645A5V4_9ZZZZ
MKAQRRRGGVQPQTQHGGRFLRQHRDNTFGQIERPSRGAGRLLKFAAPDRRRAGIGHVDPEGAVVTDAERIVGVFAVAVVNGEGFQMSQVAPRFVRQFRRPRRHGRDKAYAIAARPRIVGVEIPDAEFEQQILRLFRQCFDAEIAQQPARGAFAAGDIFDFAQAGAVFRQHGGSADALDQRLPGPGLIQFLPLFFQSRRNLFRGIGPDAVRRRAGEVAIRGQQFAAGPSRTRRKIAPEELDEFRKSHFFAVEECDGFLKQRFTGYRRKLRRHGADRPRVEQFDILEPDAAGFAAGEADGDFVAGDIGDGGAFSAIGDQRAGNELERHEKILRDERR